MRTALGCQVRVGGALGTILLFFRKSLWKKTTLGRILCDVQENAAFIHLQLLISLLPTLRWPRAVARAPYDGVQSPSGAERAMLVKFLLVSASVLHLM